MCNMYIVYCIRDKISCHAYWYSCVGEVEESCGEMGPWYVLHRSGKANCPVAVVRAEESVVRHLFFGLR